MIIIYFQFHCEINLFQRYWIISFICFFYLWKLMFSSSFSFKKLLFFQFYLFMFFLFSNNKYSFLFFVISCFFQNFYFSKRKTYFYHAMKRMFYQSLKILKKNFWKSKNCTFIQVNFSLNENIYSIFGTFYLIPLFLWNSFFIFHFCPICFGIFFLHPNF